MISINIKFILFTSMLFVVTTYCYFGFLNLFKQNYYKTFFKYIYLAASILAFFGFFALINYFNSNPLHISFYNNLVIGFSLSFFLFQLVFTFFILFSDIVRLLHTIAIYLLKTSKRKTTFQSRRNFIVKSGLFLASLPFASMLYGITKGKYNFKINEFVLKFKNLPESFDGLKIVQISDIHSGSFDDKKDVQRGIDLVNEQQADILFFTGDLVNNDAREIEPYIKMFQNLKAPMGKYAILGNHDYGDYKQWASLKEKRQNMKLLFKQHDKMQFKLLKNESFIIERNKEKLAILGVENWGRPPFQQRGDLDKALIGVDNKDFKILLSHDPMHWDYKVLPHKINIDLTLSGHTHGMQFGIEIPGFKWSPIQYFYPRWAGLYTENNQYLYINRGFGFLGFPGRVGIWPEITVIKLRKV